MTANIEAKDLTRTYETYKKPEGLLNSVRGLWSRKVELKTAVQPTTLCIEKGQIVGLVGSNGAGKTTLLKLLSGLIHPSSGSAEVLGYKPTSRSPDFLKRISILLGQKNQLWWDLPPGDSYDLLARIYELDRPKARERVRELSHLLQCTGQLQTQLRRLSLGERMKMEIIGSLLHEPEVLFLDEPTIGLDIIAQTTIREFLAKYVEERSPTVILTSHYMDDISLLADRLLLMSQGRIVYDGSVEEFTAKQEARDGRKQTLSLKIMSPPEQDVSIAGLFTLAKGSLAVRQDLPSSSIGEALQALMAVSPVQEIKIEEVEFEDVIRSFMEQDARLRSSGSPSTT